ncbi:MAG TPA: HIT domain-containing protein [Acidimicrobiales bacterium]|nr:HIT domain-containing protein [Acidimicrobiales bacterium]
MAALDHLWAGWRSDFVSSSTEAGSERLGEGQGPAGEGPLGKGCVFCRILASGLPDEQTQIVWRHRSGRAFAILNAYPYTSGHLMAMPVRHVAEVEDLDTDESADLWDAVRCAVRALKAAYQPEGVNIGANLGRAAGAGVPGHFHMHIVPRWVGDTNFMTSVANARILPEPLEESAKKLRAAWAGL